MSTDNKEIDSTIVDAASIINESYETTLSKLFKLGDYIHEFKIIYEDDDGKTITMSWQDRNKRLEEE